jgi:hypothetical protein
MADSDPTTDSEQAREESAVVRGWLRLADDVLKKSQPDEKAESDQPA